MDLPCTCDRPRLYLAGDLDVPPVHARRPWRHLRHPAAPGRPQQQAFYLRPFPDVTLCITIGGGFAGAFGVMINYVRTDEQTWSKHGPESAADEGKGIVKTPVQGGCAARDLNPEPAD